MGEHGEKSGSPTRARVDDLLAQYRRGQRQLAEDWLSRQSRIPDLLYHYTTAQGLLGIVDGRSLWASDVRYMNDSSELTYAAGLIEAVTRELVSKPEYSAVRAILPGGIDVADHVRSGLRPFIACFCEEQDLLSQWRGYGAGQAAFSLGLDLGSIVRAGALPSKTYLRQVVYEEEEQRALLTVALELWLGMSLKNLETRGLEPSDLFPYPAIWALQETLAEYCLSFKHPTFAEEREWRLIKLVDVREESALRADSRDEQVPGAAARRDQEAGGDDRSSQSIDWTAGPAEGVEINFRPSTLGLVPYVNLPIRNSNGPFAGRLPLRRVTQGPAANPALALESLRMFLDSNGFGFPTDVTHSAIPLRPHQ
jgi:hypothetical protein